jgi:hypothetical protein
MPYSGVRVPIGDELEVVHMTRVRSAGLHRAERTSTAWIKIRYRGASELSPGVHAVAERRGRIVTVYLLPGLTAARRKAALRRLRISGRMHYGPQLPSAQLAIALLADRMRTGITRAGAVFRTHPAGSTGPVMLVSGGAIAFLALSAVSVHILREPRGPQLSPAAGPAPAASAIAVPIPSASPRLGDNQAGSGSGVLTTALSGPGLLLLPASSGLPGSGSGRPGAGTDPHASGTAAGAGDTSAPDPGASATVPVSAPAPDPSAPASGSPAPSGSAPDPASPAPSGSAPVAPPVAVSVTPSASVSGSGLPSVSASVPVSVTAPGPGSVSASAAPGVSVSAPGLPAVSVSAPVAVSASVAASPGQLPSVTVSATVGACLDVGAIGACLGG